MRGQSKEADGVAARGRRAIACLSAALAFLVAGTAGLQDANANGDTRTLHLIHEHTKETASITFRRNGAYSSEGLRQLNWFLRDWRVDEQVQMDPKLFDIVWEVYREVRGRQGIHVASAYRSPQTNAALRRRSRGVAQFSQHMRGKAMDFFVPGANMARVREIGIRMQRGGVGFYPHSRHQFVHLDAGGVRSWPRLPDAHLARLFPDGRTVHIPRSGKPLRGYEEAKASILARGGDVAGYSTYAATEGGPRKSLWASLFGGGGDDDDSEFFASTASSRTAPARVAAVNTSAANSSDGGARGFFSSIFQPQQQPPPQQAVAPPPEPLPVAGAAGPGPVPVPPPVEAASIAMPLPPRRPNELVPPTPPGEAAPARLAQPVPQPTRVASASPDVPVPVPPRIPERRSEARSPSRTAGPGIGTDERAALRSLFDAAAMSTPSRTGAIARAGAGSGSTGARDRGERGRSGFSSAAPDGPRAGSFSGSAVATLPPRR
ncbi:DUF882 domain-containing protein [Enterovirga rhinocerotis]|uniref:Murein endopeptidase K n=1 Tax=Enterovirga rhinocerotis TaxID=1339210 RepID=A0A4R7BLC0_9HYPH|nr:DUF882 domain-containing protein [Enterovirga rhinocerotis]TDR85422.1 uncharacterized protein YcbK (DUF882 family) [Enterovirga rhinocerotis]